MSEKSPPRRRRPAPAEERRRLEAELILAALRALADALEKGDVRACLWLLERHPESPFRRDAPADAGGEVRVSLGLIGAGEDRKSVV